MESKKTRSKKIRETKRGSFKLPLIFLLVIIFFLLLSLDLVAVSWFKLGKLTLRNIQSPTVLNNAGPVFKAIGNKLLDFNGPNGFTFKHPNWLEIKAADLPQNGFPPGMKLLLMETDNQFIQFMALESLAEPTKSLAASIKEDLKREATRVKDLKIVKEETTTNNASLELTYFADGFRVRMFARDFLVKTAGGNKIYSLGIQLADSKLVNYQTLITSILDSAKISTQ